MLAGQAFRQLIDCVPSQIDRLMGVVAVIVGYQFKPRQALLARLHR